LAEWIGKLIEHMDELGEEIADAVTADAKVGVCPKCGKDLVMKSSAKTRGSFIGCMGWPDCDVTYPVPTGRISPLEGACPDCGAPMVEVETQRGPWRICVNMDCPSKEKKSEKATKSAKATKAASARRGSRKSASK
jgi:DNA topoisomerase-1